jgi:hypothetical protein
MAVKVVKAWTSGPFVWRTEKDGSHVLEHGGDLHSVIKQGVASVEYKFTFKEGYRCDGLSVPRAFRWFLKSWDAENNLYNMAGAIHDWFYSTGGMFGVFKRDECDDVFRGILRESGIGRVKAGFADKAVELFAGGKRHWENDDYGVSGLVTFSIRL